MPFIITKRSCEATSSIALYMNKYHNSKPLTYIHHSLALKGHHWESSILISS
jgi:hypothetical protein